MSQKKGRQKTLCPRRKGGKKLYVPDEREAKTLPPSLLGDKVFCLPFIWDIKYLASLWRILNVKSPKKPGIRG